MNYFHQKPKKTGAGLLSILGVLLLAIGIAYPDDLSAAYASLHHPLGVASPVVQLGNIPMGQKTTRHIKVFNGHLRPIILESAGSSCGCTVAEPPKQIAALHFGVISVSITPKMAGKGGQTVSIMTNVGQQSIALGFNGVSR